MRWLLLFLLGMGAQQILFYLLQTRPQSNPCAIDRRAAYYSSCFVFEDGVGPGILLVDSNGVIAEVHKDASVALLREFSGRYNIVNFGRACVSPGAIDVHTHVSELGRSFEGYSTAGQAAVAGGITTIIGMPLNSIPATVTQEAVDLELQAAQRSALYCDYGLWGGVVPESLGTFAQFVKDKRILGVKAFLSPLPSAAGYQAVSVAELERVASVVASEGIPLLVHCELMSVEEIDQLNQLALQKDPTEYSVFLETRPRLFENRAIQQLIRIVRQEARLRAHIVHLSDADSLPIIEEAKRDTGGRLTVETCPHYLAFSAESIGRGETRKKCFPPIRQEENRRRLWSALEAGAIDLVSSDHSPCEPQSRSLDTGNFITAWGGISGLQFSVVETWHHARQRQTQQQRHNGTRQLLQQLAQWWSVAPARLAGLWHRKGSLAPGKDADFMVWHPNATNYMDKVFHRNAGSPYVGLKRTGVVERTFVRGAEVFRVDPKLGPIHLNPCGKLQTRHPAS